jgi:hypothetical protein
MLDSRPSISADGLLAHTNLQPPTTEAELAVWAPFIFARTYRAGVVVSFTENRKEVAQSLVPSAMLRPWRWDFGDGKNATGWTVHHAYAKPGTRRITAYAYFPATKQWYKFDQAMVRIAAAPPSTQNK